MTQRPILKAALYGAYIGVLVCLAMVIFRQFEPYELIAGHAVDRVQLVIWPTSIFALATYGLKFPDPVLLFNWVVSIAGNMLLYAILSAGVWIGIRRARWLLPPLGLAFLVWCYVVWTS